MKIISTFSSVIIEHTEAPNGEIDGHETRDTDIGIESQSCKSN